MSLTLPIVPVDALTDAARQSTAAAQPMTTPSLSELTQRFEGLMASPSGKAAAPTEPGVLGEMLDRQQEGMQKSHDAVAALSVEDPTLSPAQQAMRTVQASSLMAADTVKMQAGVAIASGATKSLQSLLKNS